MDYVDVHLSHVAQMVWEGYFGHLDVALVEVAGITDDGELIPSSSVGNNKTWLEEADRVILEVNSWQPAELEGMHDIYYGTALPRTASRSRSSGRRTGSASPTCAARRRRSSPSSRRKPRTATRAGRSTRLGLIGDRVLDFLSNEVKHGRLPATLLPLQSGVGNIANAVLAGLDDGPFPPLTAYTEVIQDGMLEMLRSGTMAVASATALLARRGRHRRTDRQHRDYRDQIILRPQEISNHPEVIRRLGCLAMNGMLEADIYGNVNSTHVMGSSIINGIGGSGDFARNAHIRCSSPRRPSRAGRSRASCRWSATSTTPNMTST